MGKHNYEETDSILARKFNDKNEEGFSLSLSNWDDEFEKDLLLDRGFVVTQPPFTSTKNKDEKNMYGLHSPKFATDWSDEDAFAERYRCECGALLGRIFEGDTCSKCGSVVEFRDVDLNIFAWIDLSGYKIIQPGYFRLMKGVIGESTLMDIISPPTDDDSKKSNPYKAIGLLEFYDRFEEILYYFGKKKKKMDLVNQLIRDKKSVFTSHIPVYSSVLRPVAFIGEDFKYTSEDKKYNKIYSLSKLIANEDSLNIAIKSRKKYKGKIKSIVIVSVLSDIQRTLLEAWNIIFSKIDQKKGHIKNQILGGRINFSARNVIIPSPELRADEIELCYLSFLELYKYELIPLIAKVFDISEISAYEEWYKATINFNERIYDIMNYFVKKRKPKVLINRNPTIAYGSIIMVKIKRIKPQFTKDYTMSIPIFILTKLNADFDGDILNIFTLKLEVMNEMFKSLNPRKNMFISRNDGLFDNRCNLLKDQLIGLREFSNI